MNPTVIRMDEVAIGDTVMFNGTRRIVKEVVPKGTAICLQVVDLPLMKDNLIVGHCSHDIIKENYGE